MAIHGVASNALVGGVIATVFALGAGSGSGNPTGSTGLTTKVFSGCWGVSSDGAVAGAVLGPTAPPAGVVAGVGVGVGVTTGPLPPLGAAGPVMP